jgi:hypothetical protein
MRKAAITTGLVALVLSSGSLAQPQSVTNEYQAPCRDGKINARSELCAQWYAARAARDAANWSFWTLWLGVASAVISVGGLAALVITIRQGRDGNRIALEAVEGQQRPWIDFDIKPFGSIEIVHDNLEITASVTFTNIGESPAIDLSYMPTLIFGTDVDPHFKTLIANFEAGGIDWADKNLFPGRAWDRQGCAVHFGKRSGSTIITYVLIARYRTPFSPKYRFTAKAYDVRICHTDAYGHPVSEGPEIDLSQRPIGKETVMLHERQHFSGFAI